MLAAAVEACEGRLFLMMAQNPNLSLSQKKPPHHSTTLPEPEEDDFTSRTPTTGAGIRTGADHFHEPPEPEPEPENRPLRTPPEEPEYAGGRCRSRVRVDPVRRADNLFCECASRNLLETPTETSQGLQQGLGAS